MLAQTQEVSELLASLIAERKKQGLFAGDLARAVGKSTLYIKRMEDGTVRPGTQLLFDYAKWLGLKLEFNLTKEK